MPENRVMSVLSIIEEKIPLKQGLKHNPAQPGKAGKMTLKRRFH